MVNVKEKIKELEESEGILARAEDWDAGIIEEIIPEIADDYIDIYMENKIEWAKEHTEEIDNTIAEIGEFSSFNELLDNAEYYYYMDLLNGNTAEFVEIAILAHLGTEEITEEKMEKIEEIAENATANDRLEWLIEEAEEEEEEEEQ